MEMDREVAIAYTISKDAAGFAYTGGFSRVTPMTNRDGEM